MLSYVNWGPRWYHEKPVLPAKRPGWEFQAVLKGSIGLLLPEGLDVLCHRRLWLFPPGHLHGWTGEKGKRSEIAVFHFHSVPEPLARLVSKEPLHIALNPKNCLRIRELARRSLHYSQNPEPAMMMAYEHVLLELSLMIHESAALHSGTASRHPARKRVDLALQWYAARLPENPGLEEIARAVSSSPSHLRRLFHDVLQASPKQVLDQVRFHRATQLMVDPGVKLAAVGEACGFGSPSAFSRAFKAKFGCSPEAWRE